MIQQLQAVKVSEIVMNAGTQMRAWMDTNTIAEYAALMKEGVQFDPIEVYLVDNQPVLVDGFHRVNAAIKAGREALEAHITVGTMEQAIWASIAANKKNALKRNSSDIQKAVAVTCPLCGGEGTVSEAEHEADWVNFTDDDIITCPECNGCGWTADPSFQ